MSDHHPDGRPGIIAERDDNPTGDNLRDDNPSDDVTDAEWQPAPDDEEFDTDHPAGRSRLTTGLIIAVIFVLGMLAGVLATRLLAPPVPPQIVYVIDDGESSSAPNPTPTPSSSPTG